MRPCPNPKCGSTDLISGDWADGRGVRCAKCGTAFTQPKAENERVRRPASHRNLVKKFGRDFCEMCLRTVDELPPGQELHGQHVIEVGSGWWSARLAGRLTGGHDDRENVWIVCSGCHAFIHHHRTYLSHYHRPPKEDAA